MGNSGESDRRRPVRIEAETAACSGAAEAGEPVTVKQEHIVAGLIGLGAIAVLVYLYYENSNSTPAAAAAPVPSPGAATAPAYPNSQPSLNFEVGGSPINLTYNTFPPDFSAEGTQVAPLSSACGNGGCDGCGSDCDSCTQTQTPVTVQTVPPQVMQTAQSELNAYAAKQGGSRATFSQAA
jgi:hypothetical protein